VVNTGTTEDLWSGQLLPRYRECNKSEGEVQGFSRRPTSMGIGDILIRRAVGSDGESLVAIAEFTGSPEDRRSMRWRWRLPWRLTFVCSCPGSAPRAADVGIDACRMRTYKELHAAAGRRAAQAIAKVGQPFAPGKIRPTAPARSEVEQYSRSRKNRARRRYSMAGAPLNQRRRGSS
jgi:hypothetical protein